jgi:hypothetical protein
MTKSTHAVFPNMGFRRLEYWLAQFSPALRFKFIYYGIAVSLALLTFSSSGVAVTSKDPTLRGADTASRAVPSTGSQRPATSKGAHASPADSRAKPANLNSQLSQLENKTPKATNGKQVEAKSASGAEPTPTLTSPGDKIDFRGHPRSKSKNGMSNQLGQGSGSKRYGPGRRVTERLP